MNQQQKDTLKSLYENQRQSLTERGLAMRSVLMDARDSSGKDEVDFASQVAEQDFRLKLRDRELQQLREIEVALARMDSDSFGNCEDCGLEIGYKRLLAKPTAILCIACQEEEEREVSRSQRAVSF